MVQPDVTFKILIVGNPFVGKSCFLMRLCTNTFATRYASTIGEDIHVPVYLNLSLLSSFRSGFL